MKIKKIHILLAAAVILILSAIAVIRQVNKTGEESMQSFEPASETGGRTTDKDPHASAGQPSGEKQASGAIDSGSKDIGTWDIPVPAINPLYRQAEYMSVSFEELQTADIQYVDENYTIQDAGITGKTWTMQIAAETGELKNFRSLREYVAGMGGKAWHTTSDGQVFFLHREDGSRWWAMASPGQDSYEMTVINEELLLPGQKMTIKTGDYPDRIVRFSSYNSGKRFQSLEVLLSKGTLTLDLDQRIKQGQYLRRVMLHETLHAEKSSRYVLDNLPRQSGRVEWELYWEEEEEPGEFTIQLAENISTAPIPSGEEPGILRVRGVPGGSVYVEIPEDNSIEHPEFTDSCLYGDVAANGETLFWLPGGYYNVVFGPEHSSTVSSYNTRLVPVHPGKTTIMEIPPSWESVFARMEGEYGMQQSGIAITGTHGNEKTASVSFTLQEQADENMIPEISNTEINEGGSPVKIVSVDRVPVPSSVVLLLDSSGSMRGQMEETLKSARTFIQGMPDDTRIQLIDFDTEPKLLDGTTKEAVSAKLDNLKAGGATALYDSILEGLELLEGKDRPALVVFTDGVDANSDDTGPGSYASLDEVMESVAGAGIPLYTIGFGPGHDNTVLLTLADLSRGRYYPADDQQALSKVFRAISGKLGSAFRATYERPASIAPADTPVVSIILDTSGSMDTHPDKEGNGYRIDKVKNLFHDFILKLPEESVIQLSGFNDEVTVSQAMTSNKAELLQALSEMEAGGGTEIHLAVRTAFETLRPVPSAQKVMVFLTDAALINGREDESFNKLLGEIKDQNIQVLWAGMGIEDDEAFRWAAENTDGEYVISEDSKVLENAFNKVLSNIENMGHESKTAVSIKVRKSMDSEENKVYSASTIVDFPALKPDGEAYEIETVEYQVRQESRVQLYDRALSQTLYGSDVPRKDVEVFRQIPLSANGKNKGMLWSVSGASWLGRFKGIEPPNGMRLLAVDMKMSNNTPDSIPYMIPDISSHFYININNEGMYPASRATWLAESPICVPGEPGIELQPGETREGILMFLVPDSSMKQGSLHFYDTENGSIILPLAGKIKVREIELDKMPQSVSGKLSDSFSLSVNAYRDTDTIGEVTLDSDSVFRIVEGTLSSKVLALLSLDPQERMSLRLFTDKGPFRIPLNSVTASVPYGFANPVMLAPGSQNTIRMAFQIPSELWDAPCELVMDLQDEDFSLPFKGNPEWTNTLNRIKGNGAELYVNSISFEDYEGYMVADLTINDIKDGFGSGGFDEIFFLVRDDYVEGNTGTSDLEVTPEEDTGSKGLGNFASGSKGEMEGIVPADPSGEELVTGIDQNFMLLDGESRRVLVLFSMPDGWEKYNWTLQSPAFPELKADAEKKAFVEAGLLVDSRGIDNYDLLEFGHKLDAQIPQAVAKYKDRMAALNKKSSNVLRTDNNGSINVLRHTAPPAVTQYGAVMLTQVKGMEDFKNIMQSMEWKPAYNYYDRRYSPEAVLTQGWGNQNDLLVLAEELLSRLGFMPERRRVMLHPKGLDELSELTGIEELELSELPAVSYLDGSGGRHIFVIPFMKEITQLSGLVYLPKDSPHFDIYEPQAKLVVMIDAVPTDKDLLAQAKDLSDALAGGDENAIPATSLKVLEKTLPLAALSRDAVDIGYTIAGKEKGELYTAVLDTPLGRFPGDFAVDAGRYGITGARVLVELPESSKEHIITLRENEELTGIFHTLAVNLPDLQPAAAESLEKAADYIYENAEKPDVISTLKWHNRSTLSRFIAAQTQSDQDLSGQLQLITGRTKTGRCIMVTNRMKTQSAPFVTSIDLLQHMNDIHKGSDSAKKAFAIMSGITASHLEGASLPGNGMDFADIWDACPEGTRFLFSFGNMEDRQALTKHMEDSGYPEFLIRRVENTAKVMMFTDRPSIIDGEQRWAWLEIDPDTYETIGVIDTGEHGAMAEYNITLAPKGESYRDYIIGAFTGVQTSVWSVAGYSLMMDDYGQILARAKSLALGIGNTMKAVLTGTNLAKGEIALGPGKFSAKSVMDKWQVDVNQAILGFNRGFKDGVEYYFSKAGS